ncbi:MAG TPA: hypothetical protein VN540_04300 [Clostridia bacterium]|nr:hypothetical protein [Clostridia bacterium]
MMETAAGEARGANRSVMVDGAMQDNAKKPSTSMLLRRLLKTADLRGFLDKNEAAMNVPSFSEHIRALCRGAGETEERVIKRAAIERTYGHQLFNGTRRPSRDKVIQLAFGFGMDVGGAQELLRAAGKSQLYPKIKRDAALLYCFNKGADIFETQALLHELGLDLLGGEGV